jgi:hypothetical protein
VLKSFLLLALSLPALGAEAEWLTIVGDPDNPRENTVQVDPVPLSVSGENRTLRVRLSRSSQRVNPDGVPYRSFESTVLFDCATNTARYLETRFYDRPGWSGEVSKVLAYPDHPPRAMLFRDLEPNPSQRIIHAACEGPRRR